MTDIKILRWFNLSSFTVLSLMGIVVFFFFHDWLADYIKFATTVQTVLVPLVIAGAVGSTVKKAVENIKGEKTDPQGITK